MRRHRHLAQHQPVGLRPGTDQHQRRLAVGRVVRAAQRLAIDGDRGAGGQLAHRRHPGAKAALDLRRVERGKDAAAGVGRGNPMRQGQKGAEPVVFGLAKGLDLDPRIGSADDRAQGDGHDVQEVVAGAGLIRGSSNS
jgi:hypothetical protein